MFRIFFCICFLLLSFNGLGSDTRRHIANKNAVARIKSRDAWFAAANKVERKAANKATLHSPLAVALLSPYYACPYSLVRSNLVSDEFDGGKWTCGIGETKRSPYRKCVIYSFGSSSNDIFERAILAENDKCEIHIFDPTSPPLTNYNFHAYGLCSRGKSFRAGGKSFPCKNLKDIVRELNHSKIDVLKMDVEGSEWDVIHDTDWPSMSFGQILVELHDTPGKKTLPSVIRDYFSKLENAGYYQFSLEPVCGTCAGQYEIGFLHKDWTPF